MINYRVFKRNQAVEEQMAILFFNEKFNSLAI